MPRKLRSGVERPDKGTPARSMGCPPTRPAQDLSPGFNVQQLMAGMAAALQQGHRIPVSAFSGKEDIVQWTEEYEQAGFACGWTSETLVKQLRGYLIDLALTWYKSADLRRSFTQQSWDEVRSNLVETFRPATYEMDLRQDASRRQRPGEDLVEFMEERSLTCGRLGMSEKDTMASIITCVLPKFYLRLASKEFRSLDQLRQKLRQFQYEVAMQPRSSNATRASISGQGVRASRYCITYGVFQLRKARTSSKGLQTTTVCE